MPPTTTYNFGDIVLVPFPFTDQTGTKKRPAVIVSSSAYGSARRDLVVMAITSQVSSSVGFGEVRITAWKAAGLLKSSLVKPVLTTIERRLVVKKLGQLGTADQTELRKTLDVVLG